MDSFKNSWNLTRCLKVNCKDRHGSADKIKVCRGVIFCKIYLSVFIFFGYAYFPKTSYLNSLHVYTLCLVIKNNDGLNINE